MGNVISLADLAAVTFFVDQLENRLEEVDIEAQVTIDGLQEGQGLAGFVALIADGLAHYRPVLLFDVTLVVLLVGA